MIRLVSYNEREEQALARLCNRAIEASGAAAFHRTAYPTRVESESALWRYADVMQENRSAGTLLALGGLTSEEFGALSEVTRKAAAVTASHCERKIVPQAAPVQALVPFRAIRSFYPNGRVFEIGPGSGYLGAMLVHAGHWYHSTDITQAFHLWQNRLVGALQVPWWEWVDHTRPDFKVDVIACNHALNEMQLAALDYLIIRAERMLTDTGALFVEGWGAPYLRDIKATAERFLKRGWKCGQLKGDSIALPMYVLTPPHFKDAPPMRPLAERTHTVDDVKALWKELGAERNPDEAFMAYCRGEG